MAQPTQRRGEIHGLRGLAIALVVAYHLWGAGRVSGGVDVFLMISAYLMTASFVRKDLDFQLRGFLVGRFRRLIPQSAVVILAICVAGWLILPATRWYSMLDQAQASLFYVENWRLIELSTNYTSPDRSDTSPFQHYWSLAMQGQVFVLWALIMVFAMAVARLLKIRIRTTFAVVFGAITVASLAYALVQVEADPTAAYFSTFTRLWEFSLASLLALLPTLRLPLWASAPMSWIGVITVAIGGIVIGDLPFPGLAALWPLLAASLVILAGSSDSPAHASRMLSSKPFSWVGDRAYGLYLWHWPILIYVLFVLNASQLGPLPSIFVIGLSTVVADLSTRLIERRFNRLPLLQAKRWGTATIATFLIISVGTIEGWTMILDRDVARVSAQPPEDRPGARVLTPGAPAPTAPPTRHIAPGDTIIHTDWPESLPTCRADLQPKPPEAICSEYVPEGPPTKTVVMMGDSHSAQWLTNMAPIAEREGWHLLVVIRPQCRITLENPLSDAGCVEYSRGMVEYLLEIRPDFIFTVATRAQTMGPELPVDTYLDAVRPLTDAGLTIVNIRDNPRFTFKMPECVQRYGTFDDRCLYPLSEKLSEPSPLVELTQNPGMVGMDLTASICPYDLCPGVIGNIYVYMDDNHISRTYAETLQEEFETQLFQVVPR